jgi:hypothetical protein
MTYKTFFLVSPGGDAVIERCSYLDIGESLTVERVSARLEGKELGFMGMAMAFPEALAAARKHKGMQAAKKADPTLHGPYNLVTSEVPTDEALLTWFRSRP